MHDNKHKSQNEYNCIKSISFRKIYQLLRIEFAVIVLVITLIVIINVTGRNVFIEENIPTFLELEYIYSMEGAVVPSTRNTEGEITWFNTFDNFNFFNRNFDDVKIFILQDYGVRLPEYVEVDLGSNDFIATSVGRELIGLYYFDNSYNVTCNGDIIARAIFGEDYHHSTIFVYRVTPIPTRFFACPWIYTDNFRQFNYFNNIPVDVWVFPESVIRKVRVSKIGYINAQKIDFMQYPTRNSEIIERLVMGEKIIINGYVERGEEINGNGLWYLVTLDYIEGFIHSSNITLLD